MIFSSYTFIFQFLPVAVLGFWISKRILGIRGCKLWLVFISLFFYGQGNTAFLPLLGGTVLINHGFVYCMDKYREKPGIAKLCFLLSVIENLGLLFYFKYVNFFLDNINYIAGTDFFIANIMLPIGISFYTFQILAYVSEVYHGKIQRGTLLDFSVFVTFFPQLIVGPIIHFEDFVTQLKDEKFLRFQPENIMAGIFLFSIGCAKKVLIADPLITFAQNFYDTSASSNLVTAWSGVLAYTFAYYFDFSGYIDMALGLGRFFNIRLPENFASPYKARNFPDFWRRWNITVSQFFNEYIFKNIFRFGDRIGKLILATLATFIVSGIWHGAGWHYIFWGLCNGILVCAGNIMTLYRKKLPFPFAWALTFLFAMLVRVLFDSANLTQAIQVYQLMFDIRPIFSDVHSFVVSALSLVKQNIHIYLLLLVSAGICFLLPNTGEILQKKSLHVGHAVVCGILFAASLFFMGSVSNFLYFQF